MQDEEEERRKMERADEDAEEEQMTGRSVQIHIRAVTPTVSDCEEISSVNSEGEQGWLADEFNIEEAERRRKEAKEKEASRQKKRAEAKKQMEIQAAREAREAAIERSMWHDANEKFSPLVVARLVDLRLEVDRRTQSRIKQGYDRVQMIAWRQRMVEKVWLCAGYRATLYSKLDIIKWRRIGISPDVMTSRDGSRFREWCYNLAEHEGAKFDKTMVWKG